MMRNRSNELIEVAYERYSSGLQGFIRSIIPIYEDVDDILQDVFHQLTSSIDQIESLERIGSWLYRVARNRVTDLRRKKRPQSESELPVNSVDGEPLTLEEILPDLSENPEQDMLSEWILGEIDLALDELPPEQRWVFLQHEVEGRSFKELAAETGERVNTLLARKRYAIKSMRAHLDPIINSSNLKG